MAFIKVGNKVLKCGGKVVTNELYEHLSTKEVSVTSHSRTFENTGADSVPGAAELAQIPSDWGGTMST